MRYKATVSFAGVLSMSEGEERIIDDADVNDLVDCGYLVAVDEKPAKEVAAKRKGKG